jgi:cell division septation protein DedD
MVAARDRSNAETGPLETSAAPTSRAPSDAQADWAIQVGAFADKAAARRLAEGLEAKDYPVELIASEGTTKRWRVRVQPVRGQSKAREIASQLKRDERLPTWLIPLEARSGP